MLDRSKIWTGSINEAAVDTSLQRPVRLYDTTLRDGEQTVGVALNAEAKLEIATALDGLGIQRIEAGFPMVSKEDYRAFELILDAGLDAEIWGFSRALPADVNLLVDLGVPAAVIEAPVSDGKLNALGMSREKVTKRVVDAVSLAVSRGINVCFFGVDGSRADFAFLREVYSAAVDAGAREVALVDTLGIAAPEAVTRMISSAREWVGDDVAIHWHGHDDFGLATSGAIAALRAGADWIQGTINGMGERAGNTDLGEFALAVEALYGADTGLRFERFNDVAETVRRLSGYVLTPWKPVTGQTLFMRETGAVAAQFHDPPAVEPYASTLVGARRGIVLGKKSGAASIKIKAEELGLDIPQEQQAALLEQVKALGLSKGGLVNDEEFRALAANIGEASA